jgi:hypothetical protein
MGLCRVHSIVFVAIALAAASAPAMAQQPADSMANLSGLLEQSEAGKLRCPDGSTRPWKGEPTSNTLVINMACAVPAEEVERREEAAAKAVAAKNAAAEQRAALRGDAGVLAGLEATVATGSLDYLLSFRIVWFALVVGGIWLVGAIIGRLFGGGR